MKINISLDYLRKSIKDNQLEYITIKSINEMDYNKLSLIIALAINVAPSNNEIFDLIQSYNEE
jgi:lambda repressor-like predicted transcriptional regulator